MDKNTRLLSIGIGGTVLAALCCFTPVLVVLLAALGLAAWVGYLDFVLLPALAFFLGLTFYAWRRRRAQAGGVCAGPASGHGGDPS